MNEILKEANIQAPPQKTAPTAPTAPAAAPSDTEIKRERLLCVVAGGQSQAFLGKNFTIDTVHNWNEKQVNRVFNVYESRFSALISENIMNSFLDLMSKGLSYTMPLDSAAELSNDLKSDFVLNTELRKVTGRVAYSFGPMLALFAAGLITAKHVDWKKIFPKYIDNGGTTGDGGGTASDRENYFTEERETSGARCGGKTIGCLQSGTEIEKSTGGGSGGGECGAGECGAGECGAGELVQ